MTEILDTIKEYVVPFETVEAEGKKNDRFLKIHERLVRMRDELRSDPMNSIVYHPKSN